LTGQEADGYEKACLIGQAFPSMVAARRFFTFPFSGILTEKRRKQTLNPMFFV